MTLVAPVPRTFVPPQRVARTLLTTAGLGGIVFLLGLVLAPGRAWSGYLIGFTYFVGLAVAGPFFLAVLYLAGARWSSSLRRIPEALTSALPVGLCLGLLLITGTHSLYEWTHDSVVSGDHLLEHKSAWLNEFGFAVRMILYFALWIYLGRRLVRRSSMSDVAGDLRSSAVFMLAFALTFSLACVDWIQSLDPHWFSTMFALRVLSGVGCTGLAVCTVALVSFRRRGTLRDVVTRDVMDDLGKILLGLSLFWAYIWYCQYMIIWYTNIPEETGYYLLRQQGNWGVLAQANLVINFAVPFLALMFRAWRRNGLVLRRIAGWILIGHVLDLFIMIAPPIQGDEPSFGLWELGPIVGILALFTWLMLRALGRSSIVAPG